jgi:IrrE N-terminal-like domain
VSAPLWVEELAAEFWDMAGGAGPFPRQLRRPLARAVPLGVEELPGLRVSAVLAWLRRNGIAGPMTAALDRPLRACLAVRDEAGFIFLDADDDEAERHFSLAHELAHYLRDYLRPRRRATARLGQGVLAAFDGRRPPTPEERLAGLLRHAPVGVHTHLLERDPAGATSGAAAAAERDADRLACELLAPAAAVLAAADSAATAEGQLREAFGLPAGVARGYAAELFPPPRTDPLVKKLRRAIFPSESAPDRGNEG